MWSIQTTEYYDLVEKKYRKKRNSELLAVLRNLDKYLVYLNHGTPPLQMPKVKFVHDEGRQVHAIDESGYRIAVEVTRLYVWPDDTDKIIHLITLGNKRSQADDIKLAHIYVNSQQQSTKDRTSQHEHDDSGRQEETPEADGPPV